MHPHRLILLYVASNSGKRYSDYKLPSIEAQIGLSSTFFYDQKMSTSGSSARNSHLSQGGTNGNDAHVCELNCINMYCRAKQNNQEKNYPFIEGRSDKNFRVVNLLTGSIFAIILFCTVVCNSVHMHGHHCRLSPLGEVRILCRTATRAHFIVINKGTGQFYLSSDTR